MNTKEPTSCVFPPGSEPLFTHFLRAEMFHSIVCRSVVFVYVKKISNKLQSFSVFGHFTRHTKFSKWFVDSATQTHIPPEDCRKVTLSFYVLQRKQRSGSLTGQINAKFILNTTEVCVGPRKNVPKLIFLLSFLTFCLLLYY